MSKVIYPEEGGYSLKIDMSWARVRSFDNCPYHRKDRRVIADDNKFEGL